MTDEREDPAPEEYKGGTRYSKILSTGRFPLLGLVRELRREDTSHIFMRVVLRTLRLGLSIPLYPVHRALGRSKKFVYTVVQAWGADVCRLGRMKIQVRGNFAPVTGRSYLFASNHLSPLDIPILYNVLPVVSGFVANRELAKIRVVGFWTLRAGGIFVRKDDPASTTRTFKQMVRSLRRGDNLVLFPEGIMSRDGELRPFLRGGLIAGAAAGAVIVPMLLLGSREALLPGDFIIHPDQPVLVAFGEPIDTRALAPAERKTVPELVRSRIAELRRTYAPEHAAAAALRETDAPGSGPAVPGSGRDSVFPCSR